MSFTVQQMQPFGSSISSSTSAALTRAQPRQRAAQRADSTHESAALRCSPVARAAVAHERALQAQPRAEFVDDDGDAAPVLRAEHVRDQRALARAQKASDERHLRAPGVRKAQARLDSSFS